MLRATLVALLVGLVTAAGFAAPAAAAAPVPRVALVVGPVGAVTSQYRALANEAAIAARKAGAEVVTVYSPNATWPAVKDALTGASIVVYLGHGNGWPSIYRDSLYPPTQNGFGLNPVAGADDRNHQYFGESFVDDIKLAPNAIVVLSHLCYASGNSEPGLAEGSESDAVQRVDNFAAGFLRAGARAVVAEAYLGPAYYVKALLSGRSRGSIEGIWANSPTATGRHPIAGASTRTPGYTYHLDPERADGGYVRSLVSRGGLTAAEVRAGAMGQQSTGSTDNPTVIEPPAEPSLVAAGVRFARPSFRGLPIADTKTRLAIHLTQGIGKQLPDDAKISVRWDPLVLDAPVETPSPGTDPIASPAPVASPTPEASASPSPEASASQAPDLSPASQAPDVSLVPQASPAPQASAAPDASATPEPPLVAPRVDLVVAEQLGTVVEPIRARRGSSGLSLMVKFPSAPGIYRMVAMLHTADGVAYDAATQAMVTPIIVHVRPPVAVAYGAPAGVTLTRGAGAQLPVNVLNAGGRRWDKEVTAAPNRVAGESGVLSRTTTLPAQLVATWVSPDGRQVPSPLAVRLDDKVAAPGGSASLALRITAPDAPGTYLLLLDVLSASAGALSSQGSDPAIVRVTVVDAPAATPQPAPTATPVPTPAATPKAAPDAPTKPAPKAAPGSGPKRPDA